VRWLMFTDAQLDPDRRAWPLAHAAALGRIRPGSGVGSVGWLGLRPRCGRSCGGVIPERATMFALAPRAAPGGALAAAAANLPAALSTSVRQHAVPRGGAGRSPIFQQASYLIACVPGAHSSQIEAVMLQALL